MKDFKFNCFNCRQDSKFKITVENRDGVRRLVSDGRKIGEVHFICVNCGFANLIEISLDTATKLLARLSSDDPDIQDAINKAKKGDYSEALDLARKNSTSGSNCCLWVRKNLWGKSQKLHLLVVWILMSLRKRWLMSLWIQSGISQQPAE